jgi:hypothetical protein
MILQLLKALIPLPGEKEARYWHSGYFVRVFKEEYGFGWQVWRNDKFAYHNGQFVALIDGGLCEFLDEAHRSAQEYIDNCLPEPEVAE